MLFLTMLIHLDRKRKIRNLIVVIRNTARYAINEWDPDDLWAWNRRQAFESLITVCVHLSDSEDGEGPWKDVRDGELDRTVPSVRAWWK